MKLYEHTCWASNPYNMCFLLRYDYHGTLIFGLVLVSDIDIHCIEQTVKEHVNSVSKCSLYTFLQLSRPGYQIHGIPGP